jgi:hypothetical protein
MTLTTTGKNIKDVISQAAFVSLGYILNKKSEQLRTWNEDIKNIVTEKGTL